MTLENIESQTQQVTAQLEDAPQEFAEQDAAEEQQAEWADLRHTLFATSA